MTNELARKYGLSSHSRSHLRGCACTLRQCKMAFASELICAYRSDLTVERRKNARMERVVTSKRRLVREHVDFIVWLRRRKRQWVGPFLCRFAACSSLRYDFMSIKDVRQWWHSFRGQRNCAPTSPLKFDKIPVTNYY